MQKNNKESGPSLVGIELQSKEDYAKLLTKLEKYHIGIICLDILFDKSVSVHLK